MTSACLLALGEQELKDAGISDWKTDAWYLFEAAFGISRAQYYLCAREEMPEISAKIAAYKEKLVRRTAREPLQHILGEQEFMGLSFLVNEHVLIPRQDTETLVEAVLADYKESDISILDLCTGSGCIAISLAAIGGYKKVVAADISEDALKIAEKNADRIMENRSDRLLFRQGDLLSVCCGTEKFDVIVSNPPYIPSTVIELLEPEVRDFEPRLALDGSVDGLLFYRRLAEGCGPYLKENGRIYLEIGYDQSEAVCELLAAQGFYDRIVMKDLAGNDRVVRAIWRGREDKEDSDV